jgi:hypothetical protein
VIWALGAYHCLPIACAAARPELIDEFRFPLQQPLYPTRRFRALLALAAACARTITRSRSPRKQRHKPQHLKKITNKLSLLWW